MTAIVDYRAGNLTSVKNAFAALGVETVVTSDPAVVASADRVVFPGVGAARSAMDNLRSLGLADAVKSAANLRVLGLTEVVREAAVTKPFLGICLGMQILFEHSEEDGGVDCLGVLKGRVRRFPDGTGDKIPQIGWNDVSRTERGEFYFVHSYYAEKGPCTAGVTEYAGVEFTAAVRRDRLLATQFHPEKSGKLGLAVLKGFLSC